MGDYTGFLDRRSQLGGQYGFAPSVLPQGLFPFQSYLVDWSLRKGRSAIFADCGMGKTIQALAWAEQVVRHTNKRVLVLTPLAVGYQFVTEGERFGIACSRSRDGSLNGEKILIANYEQLHRFDPSDFVGIVADESSRMKHFSGATQKYVTRFMTKLPYRLLCTATAAPNDYIELGTSSEALGELGYSDMLSRFFVQNDNKSHRMQQIKDQNMERGAKMLGGEYYAKLAFRIAQTIQQWRLKGHAVDPFWRWVSTWARACRKPSDLGFDDNGFILPALSEQEHLVKEKIPFVKEGTFFADTPFGLHAEREERRRTIEDRCEKVKELSAHKDPVVIWVQYNNEGDLLERLLPDAVQVKGSQSDEEKEERLIAFLKGQSRILITKSKIAGFGLNFQHCAHVVTFATHSWESYYQAVRRCWRFGQMRPVAVDIVLTQGERRIRDNMVRKSEAADAMFGKIIKHMRDFVEIDHVVDTEEERVPEWLSMRR